MSKYVILLPVLMLWYDGYLYGSTMDKPHLVFGLIWLFFIVFGLMIFDKETPDD